MTLTKAIELLNETYQSLKDHGFHDHADAVKLGILAISLVKDVGSINPSLERLLLPGETKQGA